MGRPTAPVSLTGTVLRLWIWLNYQEVRAIDPTDTITCWYYDGSPAVNNTLCPGSNACCGYQATCLSNRLCHNPNDVAGTYVRGPCAIDGWNSECAQICLYDESTGVFPRATQCDDGSWCCNNNAECCDQGAGVFLDATGAVATTEAAYTISYLPASGTSSGRITVGSSIATTSETTSVATTAATTAATTETTSSHSITSAATTSLTSQATATSDTSSSSQTASSDSSSNSLAVPIGLGVGLGVVGVLIASGIVWFLLKRKRARKDPSLGSSPHSAGGSPSAQDALISQHQFLAEKQRQNAVELDSYDHRLELEAGGARNRHELPAQHDHLIEMP